MKALRNIGLKDIQTTKQMSEEMDKATSSVSRNLNILRDKGLVKVETRKSNVKIYELTGKGAQALIRWINSNEKDGEIKLRLHNIWVKFLIHRGDHKKLLEEDKTAKSTQMKNWIRVTGKISSSKIRWLQDVTYKVTEKHLLVNVPKIYAPPTEEGEAMATISALSAANQIRDEMKQKYNFLQFRDETPIFCNRHYAWENHPASIRLSELDAENLIAELENGKLKYDKSEGHPEIEIEGKDIELQAQRLARNLEYETENSFAEIVEDIHQRLRALETNSDFLEGVGK
jgi:DNA-binding PadR family transcriptional regulator